MRSNKRRLVQELVDDLRKSRLGKRVLAVVISGSAARGEELSNEAVGVSDIDVMIVTRSGSLVLGRSISRFLRRWAQHGFEGGRVPVKTLGKHRTIVNFEARHSGIVVDGDPAVLQLIPMDGPEDIPHFEAVRLLLNRLFEHVKLEAGLTTASNCVLKTYEAIGEAELVAERRYRPSFRDRLREVQERPLSNPRLQRVYAQALRARLNEGKALDIGHAQALDDLFEALQEHLCAFLCQDGELGQQIERLSRKLVHPAHRLYWLAVCLAHGHPSLRILTEDPAPAVWRDGIRLLRREADDLVPIDLVRAWQRSPQPRDGAAR
jgi:hypothetical protein